MTLPQAFIDEINSYNAECLDGLAETLATTAPETSIRINRDKCTVRANVDDERVAWCNEGIYLSGRPTFTFDPAMHQGLYYVQDASSMSIVHVIKQISSIEGGKALKYLDACAAPGGKTTAAISSLPTGSFVVANEYDYRRAAILAENIAKWGSPRVMVTRGDTACMTGLGEVFDVVAADVPCSGEGMMRKDALAISQWSPSLVNECAARQKVIVGNLWKVLRPGGYMIYSTCTFNRHENEDMIEYICENLGGKTIDTGLAGTNGVAEGIATKHHCCRFIPGRVRGEGLFISVIRKDGDKEVSAPKAAKKAISTFIKADSSQSVALKWINGDYRLAVIGDRLMALPADDERWLRGVASRLDVVTAGVTLATIKGRDLIPAQELALSTALNKEAFTIVETDYQTAIAYLRHEAINIEAPRGNVLLQYKCMPLGFVKNLGNRANNLYPTTWRVLSGNTPDIDPDIIHRLRLS